MFCNDAPDVWGDCVWSLFCNVAPDVCGGVVPGLCFVMLVLVLLPIVVGFFGVYSLFCNVDPDFLCVFLSLVIVL